jgi:hypothetical protein
MAYSTRRRTGSRTPAVLLITCETVPTETRAFAAIWRMVIRLFSRAAISSPGSLHQGWSVGLYPTILIPLQPLWFCEPSRHLPAPSGPRSNFSIRRRREHKNVGNLPVAV